jgi:hypothetical protein
MPYALLTFLTTPSATNDPPPFSLPQKNAQRQLLLRLLRNLHPRSSPLIHQFQHLRRARKLSLIALLLTLLVLSRYHDLRMPKLHPYPPATQAFTLVHVECTAQLMRSMPPYLLAVVECLRLCLFASQVTHLLVRYNLRAKEG